MNNCPVCGTAFEGGRCNSCGYDASADCLAYPTLTGDARTVNEYFAAYAGSARSSEGAVKQTEAHLAKAITLLKTVYSTGIERGVPKLEGIKAQMQELEGALRQIELLAKESAVERMTRGRAYYYGQGAAVDYAAAFKLFEGVAKDSSASVRFRASANNMLGLCYEKGHGTAVNKNKAFECYKLSSADGCTTASYNLGICYYNGRGTAVDYAAAFKMFSSVAADIGASASERADANNMLGLCCENGHGTAEDKRKAADYYRRASEGGCAVAKNNLGMCYYNGRGVARDYAEAYKLFRGVAEDEKAPHRASCIASYMLGQCYFFGRGVIRDVAVAQGLFKRVAEDKAAGEKWRELAKKMLEKC